jgi:hypothetical protein
VTYPNVLVLDYLKKTGKLAPEVQMTAERYIGLGYQRLLTFEVDGGGFSLMGNPPARADLTAYGLLEINDMAKVYNVDPKLIERTAAWLRKQQDGTGRWGDLGSTAFATWALVEAGQTDTLEVQRALEVLRDGWKTADDPYLLAVIANALAAAQDPAAAEALQALDALKVIEGDDAHWSAQGPSMMGSHGLTGDVETTALAVHAMLQAKRYPDSVRRGLSYLVRQKDAFGTWYSTQATILALKALSLAASTSGVAEGQGQVVVSLDGREQRVDIAPETADVVHTLVFDDIAAGEHNVSFRVEGPPAGSELSLAYQVAADYYLPWDQVPADELGSEEMQITVDYDRRDLAVNDRIAARARIVLTRSTPAVMAVVDLGVPPGFTVETADLDRMVEEGRIARYAVTGRQIILYIEGMQPDTPVEVDYRLRARFPIKAKVPASTAYDYYNPGAIGVVAPVEFVVE